MCHLGGGLALGGITLQPGPHSAPSWGEVPRGGNQSENEKACSGAGSAWVPRGLRQEQPPSAKAIVVIQGSRLTVDLELWTGQAGGTP